MDRVYDKFAVAELHCYYGFDNMLKMNKVDEFMRLPANVRARFDNNPQLLLEFVSTPGNDRALRELGFTEESLNEYDARIARAAGKAAGGDAAASGAGGGRDGASAGSGS